jgi:excisionase family DNA binding protein
MTIKETERMILTADEACAALHISRPFLFKMLNEGKIPARRLNKRWLISKKVIEDWLAGDGAACAR